MALQRQTQRECTQFRRDCGFEFRVQFRVTQTVDMHLICAMEVSL